MSRNVGLGSFDRYDYPREKLLSLNARAIFHWFLFFVGIEKNTLIWYTKSMYYVRDTWKMSNLLFMTDLG